MAIVDGRSGPAEGEAEKPGERRWPTELRILALVTAALWLIAVAWQFADFDARVASSVRSESDAWIFALTIAPLYLLIRTLAANWGVLLAISTCLLVGQILALRFRSGLRWALAGVGTAALMIGVPYALNAHQQNRLRTRYQSADAARPPSLASRAIELRSEKRLEPSWRLPIPCPDQCVDLLVFGQAESVTLTFPADGRAAAPAPFTYRLGPVGRDCAGAPFRTLCPHLTSRDLPEDRLILSSTPVEAERADADSVVIERLSIRDTRQPNSPPASFTAFFFRAYPGLLNIGWHRGRFHMARNDLPLLREASLDAALFRAVQPNRSLNGQYYPFR